MNKFKKVAINAALKSGFFIKRSGDNNVRNFENFLVRAMAIKRAGAAALDLCYVACGRFDGFWELKLQSWDKAAAMVILQEAGGKLTNFKGEPLTLNHIQNAVSNGILHKEMLSVLKPFQSMEEF